MRILALLLLTAPAFCDGSPRKPMRADFEHTTTARWLKKPVLESRLLDDMENLETWVRGGAGEMTLTRDRAVEGVQSLRLRATIGERTGRGFGYINATRRFDGEDWTKFNRISFWVYPDMPGHHVASMLAVLRNDGAYKIPAMYQREGYHYFNLENRKWNHVVWEIASLARDRVTGLVIQYLMNGREPAAEPVVTFDIDRLALERVEADHFEGWNVAPGRIALSSSGYQTGAPKTALASSLAAPSFELVRQDTGEVVLSKPPRAVSTNLGSFQVLDFSEVRTSGTYVLRAGDLRTPPFRIAENAWRDSILKALNFFYVERCGTEIPGVHGICHRDWQGARGDRRIIINGGWHDAGDLSQLLFNTAEAVYAMLSLAERLRLRNEDPELYALLTEEARWGLDWILKTNFGDGYRVAASGLGFWTNGILGDSDDVVTQASRHPYENFVAAAAEALAARVLRNDEPSLAAYSLRMAREDWRFGVESMSDKERRGRSLGERTEVLSTGILASLDLARVTGEPQYGAKARELAKTLVSMQERKLHTGWKAPITGFFYTSPEKERILHYDHPGHEQGLIVALVRLCLDLPDDPDWMKWYSAVVLHSEYFLGAMARFTEPYAMLPASVYREDEYLSAPEGRRESYRKQVLNGIAIGEGYRLRLFPVWFDRRGNTGTGLSQTKALSMAAHLRGNLAAADLAQKQLEWTVGRNPFVQSLMYGEGDDYPVQYTPSSGDIVGGLPVGIETREDNDLPYWPGGSCYNYKELWSHAVSRWLYAAQDLAGPALVTGRAQGTALEFRETSSGQVFQVAVDPSSGNFRALLPEGRYETGSNTITVLPGASYHLDLLPGHDFDFSVSNKSDGAGRVAIRITARGKGTHRLVFRTENLTLAQRLAVLSLDVPAGRVVTVQGKIDALDSPWVVVLVPDGDLARKQELTGVR